MSLPTRSARMTNAPVPFTVPPVTFASGVFSTGIGSPVTIDSSTVRRAFEHDAVDRDALARSDPQSVADHDLLERNVLLLAVLADPASRLWREPEQVANRRAGAAAGAKFQHLAQQHEDDD